MGLEEEKLDIDIDGKQRPSNAPLEISSNLRTFIVRKQRLQRFWKDRCPPKNVPADADADFHRSHPLIKPLVLMPLMSLNTVEPSTLSKPYKNLPGCIATPLIYFSL